MLEWEIEAILDLAEQWGRIDRSHRKLAHRGSYLERVWVAPSTVRRVLAEADVNLPEPSPRPERPQRRPWPEWVQYRPNQVWGYDVPHFSRCRAAANCFAIIDLVSRKWISTLLSAEETATQTHKRPLCERQARRSAHENPPDRRDPTPPPKAHNHPGALCAEAAGPAVRFQIIVSVTEDRGSMMGVQQMFGPPYGERSTR